MPDGNILITDSLNNRVIKINKESKEIVWQYKGNLINPYEADLLENGNVLIGNGIGGVVYEINPNGVIVWRYGLFYLKSVVYLNCIISILMGAVFLFFTYTKIRTKNIVRGKNIKNFVIVGTLISFITISIIILLS